MADFEVFVADADGNIEPLSKAIKVQKESKQIKDSHGVGEQPHPYNMEMLADLHEENTWHYRCCQAKAQVVTGDYRIVPVREEYAEETEEKEKLEAFLRRCNENNESAYDVFEKMWIDYEALGNLYVELVYPQSGGNLIEMYHLPAYTTKIVTHDEYGRVRTYKSEGAAKAAVKFNDANLLSAPVYENANFVAHIPNYYLKSDFYGTPDFLPALMAASLDASAMGYNDNFFSNATIPGLLIHTTGGALTNPQKSDIVQYIRSHAKGKDNWHKTLFISTRKNVELKVEKLFSEIRDASFSKMRSENRDEIIAAHGVPPRMVGVMSAGQLGGTGEGFAQMSIFDRLTVSPRQRRFANFINTNIVRAIGVEKWKIKFQGLDLTDSSVQADYVTKLTSAKVMKINEGREILGLPELEEMSISDLERLLVDIQQVIEQSDG
jgi:PBSX family phage portal protein